MNKEEFIQALRRDLSGDVPQNVLEENVQYYREYIDGEVAKGRSEEEVVGELGTPRLIAKNIEDTTEMDEEEAEGQRFTPWSSFPDPRTWPARPDLPLRPSIPLSPWKCPPDKN